MRLTLGGQTHPLHDFSKDSLTADSSVYTLASTRMVRKKYSFYIEAAQSDALKAIKERDGVLESEQIRRALDDWIETKNVPRASASRRRRLRRKS
jgi:hypothetical protein